jgi:hypothetical protein
VNDEAPDRITVVWSQEARADLRAIDRETEIQILHCIDRYLSSRADDVKRLKPPEGGLPFRCGDYHVFLTTAARAPSRSPASRHRREAYR